MEVVRCIAEIEVFRAERNTFQYVTYVVISSETIHRIPSQETTHTNELSFSRLYSCIRRIAFRHNTVD